MSAAVRRYEDLVCWQLSYELHRRVVAFSATEPLKSDWKFRDQIRDASASAPRNIAEGFGRYHPRDFARFVEIARGSLVETHHHLRDAYDRKYLSEDDFASLTTLANRSIGATTNFLRYLQTSKPRTGPETQAARTKNPRTKAQNQGPQNPEPGNPEPGNPEPQNPRTKNPRTQNPRTKNPQT